MTYLLAINTQSPYILISFFWRTKIILQMFTYRNIKNDAAITEMKPSSYRSAPSPEIFYICKEVVERSSVRKLKLSTACSLSAATLK